MGLDDVGFLEGRSVGVKARLETCEEGGDVWFDEDPGEEVVREGFLWPVVDTVTTGGEPASPTTRFFCAKKFTLGAFFSSDFWMGGGM